MEKTIAFNGFAKPDIAEFYYAQGSPFGKTADIVISGYQLGKSKTEKRTCQVKLQIFGKGFNGEQEIFYVIPKFLELAENVRAAELKLAEEIYIAGTKLETLPRMEIVMKRGQARRGFVHNPSGIVEKFEFYVSWNGQQA